MSSRNNPSNNYKASPKINRLFDPSDTAQATAQNTRPVLNGTLQNPSPRLRIAELNNRDILQSNPTESQFS